MQQIALDAWLDDMQDTQVVMAKMGGHRLFNVSVYRGLAMNKAWPNCHQSRGLIAIKTPVICRASGFVE